MKLNYKTDGLLTIVVNGKTMELFTQKEHITWYLNEISSESAVNGLSHRLKEYLEGDENE